MIKVIHTSDWHLGLRFCGYDPTNEYTHFFEQLSKTVSREKPDALLIVGDVFDIPIPANDLLALFEQCLEQLHKAYEPMQIIITSGNHDNSRWLETQAKKWSAFGVQVIGQLRKRDASYDIGRHIITLTDNAGNPKGYIIGMPYMTSTTCPVLSEKTPMGMRLPTFMNALANRVEMINMTNAPVVFMAHCFVLRDRLPGIEHQKATLALEDVPMENIDYLALGHAHSSKNIGSPKVRNCGSPWPITPKDFQRRSFSVVTIKERKGEVKVSERWVKSLCPLILLPKKAMRTETVLKQLTAFPEEEQAFIDLYVRADKNTNEKEFIQQCKQINTGKKARLCSVIWEQGENQRFTNIADTNYLSYGHALSNQKETDLPNLVEDLQKSLNAQLTQLDKAINELHRQEDKFTSSINKMRTQLRNLALKRGIRKDYEKIKDEYDYLCYTMDDPKYKWENDFIARYRQIGQSGNANGANNRADLKALNERQKSLIDRAKALQRGVRYLEFELSRQKTKIENIQKRLPAQNQTETTGEKSTNNAKQALDEHKQKEKALSLQGQKAQALMRSIESLLNIKLPAAKGNGGKTENLIEQLEKLQQEIIEVASATEQIKRNTPQKELSVEDIIAKSNFLPGLWSTEIWKDQQFIETIIREHRFVEAKKGMLDRSLASLQKKLNELEVDAKLEESGVDAKRFMEFLEPWMTEQIDRFKEQHRELERQQTQLRHRVNDINLIHSKLSDAEETNEET